MKKNKKKILFITLILISILLVLVFLLINNYLRVENDKKIKLEHTVFKAVDKSIINTFNVSDDLKDSKIPVALHNNLKSYLSIKHKVKQSHVNGVETGF